MKKQLIFSISLIFVSVSLMAQTGWNWPKDINKAKEKNALYTDALKNKQFAQAAESHQWLLDEAPNLNASLYINGAKIYEGLAKIEKDPAKKVEYQDKALSMYDLRIKYFNKETKVLNRKAFVAYKYYSKNKNKYKELLNLFDKVYKLNKENVLNNNLVAYMDVVRRYKLSGGDISDEEVINIYSLISDIINAKIKKNKNVDKLERIQENVDKMLTATITVDCNFVENNLGPKMNEYKDVKMAKKVFQLLLTGKCSDSPLFLKAAIIIFKSEPTFSLAKVIALKHTAIEEKETSIMYYDKAIELTNDNLKKAKIYFNKAQLYASNKQKSAARTNSRRALSYDPSLKDAYTLIGNLYMQSHKECSQGISKVDDRLVFIAAYNQYKKAGNVKAMADAKEQFPSIEEMFELGHEEGKIMNVGCWINESVKLKRRPN